MKDFNKELFFRNMNEEERIEHFKKEVPPELSYFTKNFTKLGFFQMPAGLRFHGAFEGGLYAHCFAVTSALVELTEKLGLKWEREESPYVVGMCHDLCKCDNYFWNAFEERYEYSQSIIDPDHGSKSVIIAQQFMHLTEEEIACIRWHMGAYEKDTRLWEYFGRAIEKFPNVLYTHTADMIASKIIGV